MPRVVDLRGALLDGLDAEDGLLQLEEELSHDVHLGRRSDRRHSLLLLLFDCLDVLFDSLHHLLFVCLEVPSNRDPHHRHVGVGFDGGLQFLLNIFRSFDCWKADDHSDEILHRFVLEVHILESAKLVDSVTEAEQEAADVDDPEEGHLGPHQSLLSLVAPSDQDAVRSWSAEFASSECPQVLVHEGRKANPDHSNEDRPDHEEHLEVEVQRHARTCNLFSHQIRG
mmetsp:Transcript_28066/g.60946  ORF Transcript_28066/g.60946 Transcript_28066/m.60946 type:complete len:226 (+) Transcript_28066:358-1035(+)